MFKLFFKIIFLFRLRIVPILDTLIIKAYFKLVGVKYSSNLKSFGLPMLNISLKGTFLIGESFIMNNGSLYNWAGRSSRCQFKIEENAIISIGDNVGVSSLTIWSRVGVKIGNNVLLGNNCVIYDSDYHSLDWTKRIAKPEMKENINNKPVYIEDNVFIGAHTTILKGVTIGKGSIVSACSVVTKSIPQFQMWGGNPAKFIKVL